MFAYTDSLHVDGRISRNEFCEAWEWLEQHMASSIAEAVGLSDAQVAVPEAAPRTPLRRPRAMSPTLPPRSLDGRHAPNMDAPVLLVLPVAHSRPTHATPLIWTPPRCSSRSRYSRCCCS